MKLAQHWWLFRDLPWRQISDILGIIYKRVLNKEGLGIYHCADSYQPISFVEIKSQRYNLSRRRRASLALLKNKRCNNYFFISLLFITCFTFAPNFSYTRYVINSCRRCPKNIKIRVSNLNWKKFQNESRIKSVLLKKFWYSSSKMVHYFLVSMQSPSPINSEKFPLYSRKHISKHSILYQSYRF